MTDQYNFRKRNTPASFITHGGFSNRPVSLGGGGNPGRVRPAAAGRGSGVPRRGGPLSSRRQPPEIRASQVEQQEIPLLTPAQVGSESANPTGPSIFEGGGQSGPGPMPNENPVVPLLGSHLKKSSALMSSYIAKKEQPYQSMVLGPPPDIAKKEQAYQSMVLGPPPGNIVGSEIQMAEGSGSRESMSSSSSSSEPPSPQPSTPKMSFAEARDYINRLPQPPRSMRNMRRTAAQIASGSPSSFATPTGRSVSQYPNLASQYQGGGISYEEPKEQFAFVGQSPLPSPAAMPRANSYGSQFTEVSPSYDAPYNSQGGIGPSRGNGSIVGSEIEMVEGAGRGGADFQGANEYMNQVYRNEMFRGQLGKNAAMAAGGAAMLGLAAYGVHKAYKYLKRKRAPVNSITSEAGSGNTGGQGPAPGESESANAPSDLGNIGAIGEAIGVPGGAEPDSEVGADGAGGAEAGAEAGSTSGAGGAGAGAGASGGGAPPSAGAGQQVQVNAVDENGAPLFPQKTAAGPNTDRTDPITPATGSKQTVDTPNSVTATANLRAMAEDTVKKLGPEAVHGNARERANMGKGALDSYSFNGPYDYPVYPGGRPDETLTLMGAWRTTRGGNGSSLWYSKKTAKGADAKRNKYFKWSTKGGGNWRKLTKDEMVNVFQKRTGAEGGNFYGVPAGSRFKDLIAQQIAEKDKDIALGRSGAQIQQNRKMGYVGGQSKKKRKIMNGGSCSVDMSAHQ